MSTKIISIRRIETSSKRYDISVLNNNNFYANRILVHNCQNIVAEYNKYLNSNLKFYATEKLDGSSATYYLKDGVFGVCSRNLDLFETESNTFWKVARQLEIEEKLKSLNGEYAIQGELIGEGIQGNPYKIKGQTVKFFNVFDINNQKRLPLNEFVTTIHSLDLRTVPIYPDFKLPNTVDDLLLFADGKSELNPQTDREGLVVRSHDSNISFKVISNKFLLNEK